MKLHLSESVLEWQAKAREFAETELIPWEVEAEMNQGELPPEVRARHQKLALDMGLSAMDVPEALGGLALCNTQQVAVWEQLGRVTNALCWCFSEPQLWMFEACNQDQIDRYILPMMRGEAHECYAITEEHAGSDVSGIETTALVDNNDLIVNGEKWYVTSANHAEFFVLQARLSGGTHAGEHVLMFVDQGTPGIELKETPLFSHTFAAHHPTYSFDNVRVPASNLIGNPGDGMQFTRSWFRRERLMIAARCCGAAARLIEEATKFAKGRVIGGEPLAEKQMIQATLADSVTELWAARLMTFEAADAHDRGEPLNTLHSRCSVAKLYSSEMANRVADRAVQIFGGRGYMRKTAAERFFRELRVDRIWEGTSEIQRLIIARGLLKRGLTDL